MGNLFGVKEGTPFSKWPTEALERLRDGLGRNGLTEDQQKTETEVAEILAERSQTGVDYSSEGELSTRV